MSPATVNNSAASPMVDATFAAAAFGGNSPLSGPAGNNSHFNGPAIEEIVPPVSTPMFFGEIPVGSASGGPSTLGGQSDESINLDSALAMLSSEVQARVREFVAARQAGNETAVDEALRKLERAKREFKAFNEYSSVFGGAASGPTDLGAKSAGLNLSHRDLPKFQLSSCVRLPYPNEEAFESVEHFLVRFEAIIKGSAYRDIELVWRKFLPLCLQYTDHAWVETELLHCKNWNEARALFKEHHGSNLATRHYTDMVFTMRMNPKESISDYSKKFLQAVYNAGLPSNDPRIADRFLASLTLPVQTLIRVTVARVGRNKGNNNDEWTVDFITQVGRDILGDDASVYAEAASLIPGANKTVSMATRGEHSGEVTKKQFKKKFMNKVTKNYFCKNHGANGTHDTKDCFSSKKHERAEAGEKRCFRCKKPWVRGHTCDGKKKVLAVRQANNEGSAAGNKEASEEDLLDQATANVSTMMEGVSFDCKYQEKLKDKRGKMNLLTPILIENHKLMGLVDTGSDVSFISSDVLLNKLKINKLNKLNGSYNFLSNESNASRMGTTDLLQVKYINGISFKHKFDVMKFNSGFDFDVLLGEDILDKLNISLTGVAYRLDAENESDIDNAIVEDAQIFENANIEAVTKYEPDNSPAGTPEQREKFFKTISEVLKKNREIPITSSCTMEESIIYLPTKEGATAYRRQYPIPFALRPVLDKQVKEWLDTGVIVKSNVNTSFNSPLLLVPKRNKAGEIVSHRVCLDVRMLNNILPPTFNYPVPLIRDIFDNLQNKKVFSTIDLSNAYHRFKVAPEDVHKLTFTHGNNQYSFIKGCFGVKMLTSQFQKCLSILFDGVPCVQNFVDDCIVASDSYEQHAEDVKQVLEKLTSVNLIINPSKSVWFQKSVRLLGFSVSTEGIKVDKNKLTSVAQWLVPKGYKQIQQFMGLINYFRDFIPMISKVAEPITRLSHAKNVSELWGDEQTRSFEALKNILQSNLVLSYPDLTKQFFVATDASLYGVAAVLFQRDDKGRDKYISFVSASLSPSQRRWNTTKRELYAIVMALQKFRKFLYGRHFRIYTDHKALIYLNHQKVMNPMMIGWAETLLQFDFDVVHIPGILNRLPDQLSRLYPPLDESEHKLEEDSGRNKIIKVVAKRKKYSKDKELNVLFTKLVENKNETLDYLTPPESERDAILRETHEFGHFGYQAIVRDIHSQGMHWTNIYEDAKTLVSSCKECQRHNISKRGYHPLTNVVAQKPFTHIAIDLAGPLNVSSEGYIYLLVLVDVCTKYVVLRPLKNKQSDTVALELIKIFGDYGFPQIIQSDNGTEFRNQVMGHISKNLGIDRRYSTPYNPMGNGIAEANVKIALNTLRKMIKSDGRDWNLYLPIVQLCINRFIKSKTLSSPFSLMYARRVNMPDDYESIDKKVPIPRDLMTVAELEERIKYMEDIVFPAINERTEKINEEYAKKYNSKKVMADIPVGSHVMVRLDRRDGKLSPIFRGPYTVVRRNTGGSYELKDEQNELLHRNYSPSELKVVNIDESNIEDEYFEVEDIRDHRGSPGNREYLVKWLSYGERENTWQKASDFTDPTIIQKYWKKHDELKRRDAERAGENKSTDSNKPKNKNKMSSVPKVSNEKSNETLKQVQSKKRQLPVTLSREERLLKRRTLKK